MALLHAISKVQPGLYLSGYGALSRQKLAVVPPASCRLPSGIGADALKALGITLAVDATNIPQSHREPNPDFTVISVPVSDSERSDLMPYFRPVADSIQSHLEAGGKVHSHPLSAAIDDDEDDDDDGGDRVLRGGREPLSRTPPRLPRLAPEGQPPQRLPFRLSLPPFTLCEGRWGGDPWSSAVPGASSIPTTASGGSSSPWRRQLAGRRVDRKSVV